MEGDLHEMISHYKAHKGGKSDAEQVSADKLNLQLGSDIDLFNPPAEKILIEKAHQHRKEAAAKTIITTQPVKAAAAPKAECPVCQACPVKVAEQATAFNVVLGDDKVNFKLVSDSLRDQLASVEVIDHDRIMGYSTYNDILTQTKSFSFEDRESDYYNVTVNFVVKRLPKYEADLLEKKQALGQLDMPTQDVNQGYF